MMVRVISLPRSTERRRSFQEANPFLKYEFHDAVDGRDLPCEIFEEQNYFTDSLSYSDGAVGCALSHLALWEEAMRTGAAVTVAEDDAIFRRDFHAMQEALLSQMHQEWDIIVWAWNFDSILSLNVMPHVSPAVAVFDQESLRASIPAFVKSSTVPTLFRLDKCFGTPAYTISPKGAGNFKRLCFPLNAFRVWFPLLNREIPNNGIDIAMNRYYAELTSFVSFPPLAVTKNDHSISTVQNVGGP
jgi:GR25 family glycosyltransferase involved in LPS biosynthesis